MPDLDLLRAGTEKMIADGYTRPLIDNEAVLALLDRIEELEAQTLQAIDSAEHWENRLTDLIYSHATIEEVGEWSSDNELDETFSEHLHKKINPLESTIQRVRDLHEPIPLKEAWGNCRQDLERLPVCDSCTTDDEYTTYPCPTIQALGDQK